MKRHRVELSDFAHEAVRYFALLRGVPTGKVMTQGLAYWIDRVVSENPPVRAHMLAWQRMQDATEATVAPGDDMVPF